jgi:uncharacterized membrane protein
MLNGAVLVVLGLTILGGALTWPSGGWRQHLTDLGLATDTVPATVTAVEDCPPDQQVEAVRCELVVVRLTAGDGEGRSVALPPLYDSRTEFALGDRVVLNVNPDAPEEFRYSFADRARQPVLWALALVFAGAVVVLGRLRGLMALAGLAASLLVLGLYTLPALLDGRAPLVVSLITASAVAAVALYLAHGPGPMTSVALLGTVGALSLTTFLGLVFIDLARFSGFAEETAFYLEAYGGRLDVRGLLLAGVVIGALGALDDMTVTQASVVWELRAAASRLTPLQLFTSAMKVGRDHVAATVNTLVLAYAGASLPLLVLFVVSQQSLGTVANSEIVAVEIVRTLVGSIGLVASVPLTTWLSVRLVAGPVRRLGAGADAAGNRLARPD